MARQATSGTRAPERSRMGNIRASFRPLLREIFRFSLDTLEEKEKQTVTV